MTAPTLQLYKRRWYVLVVFMLIVINQNNIWLTYGATSTTTQEAYGINANWVNALGAAGPVAFLIIYPFSSWAIGAMGLRVSVVAAAALVAAGSVIRVFCMSYDTFWMVGAGQLLNAAAGPIVMSVPPLVSAAWFPAEERTLATALGSVVSALGCGLAFLVGLGVTNVHQLHIMLYAEGGFCVLVFIMSCIYFPSAPPTPPTLSAAERNHVVVVADAKSNTNTNNNGADKYVINDEASALLAKHHHHQHQQQQQQSPPKRDGRLLFKQSIGMFAQRDACLVLLTGGILTGVNGAWVGVIVNILVPLGYSQPSAQLVGLMSTIAGTGGILFGKIHDSYYKNYKGLLLIIYGVLALASFSFTITTSGIYVPHTWSVAIVFVSTPLIGMCGAGIYPILYEALAETTFPVSEDVSAGLVSLINNLACFVYIFVADYLTPLMMNCLLTGTAAVCFFCTIFIRKRYPRSNLDAAGAITTGTV
eukprot:TRINITY_DN7172_c0_g1_i3.p1 TRINITY_DN7172_c0_g1~~TRINITY_DN7172_c0_g1_i3.p1  ORF type:complete len:490 (-),score=73.27 TRINITY_DN7172_c0_g1_i3:45-1472(-)